MPNNALGQGGVQASSYGEMEEHAIVDGVAAKKVFPIIINPLAQTNPSYALSYTSDELTQIDMTIGTTTYRRTLTWTDNNLTALSVWSEV